MVSALAILSTTAKVEQALGPSCATYSTDHFRTTRENAPRRRLGSHTQGKARRPERHPGCVMNSVRAHTREAGVHDVGRNARSLWRRLDCVSKVLSDSIRTVPGFDRRSCAGLKGIVSGFRSGWNRPPRWDASSPQLQARDGEAWNNRVASMDCRIIQRLEGLGRCKWFPENPNWISKDTERVGRGGTNTDISMRTVANLAVERSSINGLCSSILATPDSL
eukprot:scaffold1372_cov351-Pavlova_lutheri.AAC.18